MVAFAIDSVFVLSALFLGSWAMDKRDASNNGHTYTDCGGVFDQTTGVIQTPNFPNSYPTPIYCDWLIRAPPGNKIIIYFTQYYMKDSVYVTSYDYYQDRTTHLGQRDLGRLTWEHDLITLVSYQRFVLIQFSVESIGNRHLRVMDFLLEVYGFNITYEIVDESAAVTKPTCSVKECSYLGNCLAAADFSKYECECFPEFMGENCQYGPYCRPDKNINQCTNGGKCKYFFGSLINQCECLPGFAGAYCEIAVAGNGAEFFEECKALNCSELCDIDESGKLYCSCLEGYKMHETNDTCIPIARYRMDVTLEFNGFADLNEARLEEVTRALNLSIKQNGISTLVKFGVTGLRNTSRTTVLDFHFYCMVSEVKQVYNTLKTVIDKGSLAGVPLLKTQPKYDESPELMLAEVANHDPNPTLRGSLLTLMCAAKGSRNIQFRWYKDSYLMNTNLTLRNAWEAIIPHTPHGKQLSVLNIDKVTPLDAGEFTCMVSDYGETQLGNVEVKVNDYPRVQLYPMSLSVPRGQPISITCLSPDDSWLKFLYEWYRNGVKIEVDSETAYVEGMYPTGVRLVVVSVTAHAEYTCKVTNEAGSANVTAYVHVFSENGTELFCPKNYEGQVMWQNTSGGHFDIKPCPTEQGGHAKRHCVCDPVTQECNWLKPNFAKCQSLALVEIYDEMELLRFGYQKTTLRDIFNKLYQIISPVRPAFLYSGDIDMVAHILKELIIHMRDFPQLVLRQELIPADELIEMISSMLGMSSTATPDEKELLLVGPCIVQIVNTLLNDSFRSLEYNDTHLVSHLSADLRVHEMQEIPETDTTTDTDNIYREHRQRRGLSGEIDDKMHSVLTITSEHLPDLLTYRERAKNNRPYMRLVSRIYSLASYEFIKVKDWRPITVRFKVDHDQKIDVSGANTTTCLSWNYDPSNLFVGEWIPDNCSVVESSPTATVCDCRIPGHFIAAVVHSNRTMTSVEVCTGGTSLVLIIGYSISLIIILTALLFFIRALSQLVSEIYTVHFIAIACLAVVSLIDLICVVNIPKSEAAQHFLRSFLLYLYFVLFTTILAETIQVYLFTSGIKQAPFTKLKFTIGCLGFPVLLLIPTILVSSLFDKHFSCSQMCWLSLQMRQFYAFIFLVICLVVAHAILLVVCVLKLRKWNEEWRYADKMKYLKCCGKATLILVLLSASILLSVDITLTVMSAQLIAHVLFHLALRISVLLFRCCLDNDMKSNSSSFRAFVKPERVQNADVNQEEYSVSRYYDEINRQKYSVDRTRQLSSLLGSSMASGESSSDTKSTTITGGSLSSKESEIKMHNACGGNSTIESQIDGSNGGASFYVSDNERNINMKPLEKVSSFIRSDDDEVNPNPILENGKVISRRGRDEKKSSVNPRNPPAKSLSAQYVKKSNNCYINTDKPKVNNTTNTTPAPYHSLHNKNTDNGKHSGDIVGNKGAGEGKRQGSIGKSDVLMHRSMDDSAEEDQSLPSARLLSPVFE